MKFAALKDYRFQPTLIPTCAFLLLFPMLLGLGFWQIHRADEKTLLLQRLRIRMNQPPIAIKNLPRDQRQWQYTNINVQGRYDNRHQFLLDNKIYRGRVGYQVITPMQIAHDSKWLLVNRGWVPAAVDRQTLPQLKTISGLQSIRGKIRQPLGQGLVLKSTPLESAGWPRRLQRLNFQAVAKWLHRPVYPFVLLLDPNSPHGFVRRWTFVNMKPAKHIGYAVQWFALAGVLLIIYVAVNIKRKE